MSNISNTPVFNEIKKERREVNPYFIIYWSTISILQIIHNKIDNNKIKSIIGTLLCILLGVPFLILYGTTMLIEIPEFYNKEMVKCHYGNYLMDFILELVTYLFNIIVLFIRIMSFSIYHVPYVKCIINKFCIYFYSA